MKTFFQLMHVFIFILVSGGLAGAANFTVRVPTTDDYLGYIKPLKPGSSHLFQVNVTNNKSTLHTVSIVKGAMGGVTDWISIDQTSLSLKNVCVCYL